MHYSQIIRSAHARSNREEPFFRHFFSLFTFARPSCLTKKSHKPTVLLSKESKYQLYMKAGGSKYFNKKFRATVIYDLFSPVFSPFFSKSSCGNQELSENLSNALSCYIEKEENIEFKPILIKKSSTQNVNVERYKFRSQMWPPKSISSNCAQFLGAYSNAIYSKKDNLKPSFAFCRRSS